MISALVTFIFFTGGPKSILVQASNRHVPVFFGERGAQIVDVVVTCDDIEDREETPVLVMGTTLSYFPIRNPDLVIFSASDIEGFAMSIILQYAQFFDRNEWPGRPSLLAMGYGSSLLEQQGPLAIVRNPNNSTAGDLILRSTREFFEASCVPGSIMSIREISHYVIIQTVEDGDHILETPTPFVFSANYKSILSLPEASFRRYIQKMVALGGIEPQETHAALMNERIISVGNCTAELVAQLPSIRVQFTDPSLMHIELEPADFIQVNNESRTCTLALDINADQMVLFNPLRVPFMNIRMSFGGVIQICDSMVQPRPIVVSSFHRIEAVNETNIYIPILFDAFGGHVEMRINGVAYLEVVVDGGAESWISDEVVYGHSLESSVANQFPSIPSISIYEQEVHLLDDEDLSGIAIGPSSTMVQQLGAVAVLRDSHLSGLGNLVLRSTPQVFEDSCIQNSTATKRISDNTIILSLGGVEIPGPPIPFEITGSSKAGPVAQIPRTLMTRIGEMMNAVGAVDQSTTSSSMPIFGNCTDETVARLPSLQLFLSNNHDRPAIELLASEYIEVMWYSSRCKIKLFAWNDMSNFRLYPLRIPSMNTRYSSDGTIQICRSGTSQTQSAPSSDRVLELVVPYISRFRRSEIDRIFRRPDRNIFRRGLRMIRCALTVIGCRRR